MFDGLMCEAVDAPGEREVISRSEAKARGLKRYFTGIACPRGHITERETGNAGCLICNADATKAYRAKSKDKTNATRRARWDRKKEEINSARRKAYSEDGGKKKDQTMLWRSVNADRWRAGQTAWRQANSERINQKRNERLKNNPYLKEAKTKSYRRWYVKNCEDQRSRAKVRWKLRYAANRECILAQKNTHRARRKRAPGNHTQDDIMRIGNAQRWRCAWCRKPCKQKYHVDHITALASGGSNWPANLCIACPACNLSKRAKDPICFARERGMLI